MTTKYNVRVRDAGGTVSVFRFLHRLDAETFHLLAIKSEAAEASEVIATTTDGKTAWVCHYWSRSSGAIG